MEPTRKERHRWGTSVGYYGEPGVLRDHGGSGCLYPFGTGGYPACYQCREVVAVEERQKLVKKSLEISGEKKQATEIKNKVQAVKNSLEVTNSSIKLTPR